MTPRFSGRKYIVICSVSTYCFVIVVLGVMAIIGKASVEVFLAAFSGLGGLVMYITKAYFDDKERNLTEGGTK